MHYSLFWRLTSWTTTARNLYLFIWMMLASPADVLASAEAKSMQSLIVINEQKLSNLLDLREEALEASGVTYNGKEFLVIFDNANAIVKVQRSLKTAKRYHLDFLNDGYEGLSYSEKTHQTFLIKEAVKDKKHFHGLLISLDEKLKLINEQTLDFDFKSINKGFEGVDVVYSQNQLKALLLCEGNACKSGKKGRKPGAGQIQVFSFDPALGQWQKRTTIRLPSMIQFEDYSGLSVAEDGKIAITSQASSAMWVGKMDLNALSIIDGGTVYGFPESKYGERMYCNIEGVDWLDDSSFVLVSDASKSSQAGACKVKSESIHIMKLP